ncbi:efflux RND transporter periplasmic adaptor subunit [Aliarcobacter skirrowii]|uniref:efflux RND transporter periplasmic adaptor subunit n=1 Tax=Aliarcobacter skirrowii TaxID=28200 RepID=UPI0029A5ABAE|nr:efflux RND transporter periplasmic adaptor subunit [Aliarcobacter skirrowii]MDX4026837.1 efflux RND transporter periplasmic adaptor subunit [Aliarcobacter skirrowii]MDX4035147.1 efflux RND transporter periplasmic adaptor subunit [Aliarcobacter skirrowii]MDX4038145.1 efflux RND transporter periplasmic adaptor subunit [Aliarcobacter skirrowii]
MKIFRIFILFTVVLFFISCEKKAQVVESKPVEVGFINPKEQSLNLEIELFGRVKAKEIAQIRPQITGIIEKRVFTEGSFVNKGDILYQIDKLDYIANVNSAKASLNSAKATLLSTKAKNDRAKELLKFDGISKQEADDIEASYLQALALVNQREAELQSANINLQRCDIKAPISGYIGISNVTTGALVTANQTQELVDIKDSSSVYLDLTISYKEYLNLKNIVSFDTQNSSKVRLVLEDDSKIEKFGVLQSKELSVDPNSGTVTLRAVFENSDNSLLSGMMTKAYVQSSKKFDGFLIPQQAVLRDQKANPIITLINDDFTTTQKRVKILRAIDNFWLIEDRLNPNDKIIVEGLNKINRQSKVSIKDLNTIYEVKK